MKNHDEYSDVMTILEFRETVELGCIVPSDGIGFWATETECSDLPVWSERRPSWATHVAWYNK